MKLRDITAGLPKKAVSRIAKKLNVSHSLVSLVLAGKRENNAVIDAAIDLIEEEKKEAQEREQRINKLLGK